MARRLVPLFLTAALGVFWSSLAGAASPDTDSTRHESKVIYDPQVTKVSYSTGERGNRLKWLPYRPDKQAGASADLQSDESENSEEAAEVRQVEFRDPPAPKLSAAEDPLKNPFGDAKQRTGVKPLAEDRKLARVAGPNGSGPVLRPIAAEKNILPLPTLSTEDKDKRGMLQESPKLLLTEPSNSGDKADELRKVPSVDEELAANPQRFMDACPPKGSFKSIRDISDDITAKEGKFPRECDLAAEEYMPRAWCPTTFAWTAPGTCHKPLYFEQVQVERYGHSWGPLLQPIISGAHFFITVPILPYAMGVEPPCECMYSLGYYRPGSCAPYMLDPLPISVRGGLMQAGTVVGAAYIIP